MRYWGVVVSALLESQVGYFFINPARAASSSQSGAQREQHAEPSAWIGGHFFVP